MDTLATVPEGGGRKEHSEVKSLALHGHPMLDDHKNKYQLHTCVSEYMHISYIHAYLKLSTSTPVYLFF